MAATRFDTSATFAAGMDARDPLAEFRQRFHIPPAPDGGLSVYLCGHSLGLQPKRAREYIEQELHDWAGLGVEAHFHGRNPWMPYHRLLTENMAGVVGAQPLEVDVPAGMEVELASKPGVRLEAGRLELPPMTAAIVSPTGARSR